MVGLDVRRAELAGLVAGEEDHAACFLSVEFEHLRTLPDGGADWVRVLASILDRERDRKRCDVSHGCF